jgi:hypothetical protein
MPLSGFWTQEGRGASSQINLLEVGPTYTISDSA